MRRSAPSQLWLQSRTQSLLFSCMREDSRGSGYEIALVDFFAMLSVIYKSLQLSSSLSLRIIGQVSAHTLTQKVPLLVFMAISVLFQATVQLRCFHRATQCLSDNLFVVCFEFHQLPAQIPNCFSYTFNSHINFDTICQMPKHPQFSSPSEHWILFFPGYGPLAHHGNAANLDDRTK